MFGLSKIICNGIFNSASKKIHYGKNIVRFSSKSSEFDKKFIIVRVTPHDYETVIDLFRYSYFNEEPVVVAAGLSYKSNPVLENRLLEGLSQGMSLMALCRRTASLVGASINMGNCPWDPEISEVFANTCTCPKVAEVVRFYAHISRMGNMWHKFNEHKIFEVAYLATDVNNTGSGIGYNLVKKSIELAKDLTYNVVRVDATSFYTQKICQKLGMDEVSELVYTKYVNCNGKPIFHPPSPHTSVKVYVSFPHSTPAEVVKLLKK